MGALDKDKCSEEWRMSSVIVQFWMADNGVNVWRTKLFNLIAEKIEYFETTELHNNILADCVSYG